MIFLFQTVKCSYILEVFSEVNEDTNQWSQYFKLFILLAVGGFIAIAGISYMKITFFVLIAFLLDAFCLRCISGLKNIIKEAENSFASQLGFNMQSINEFVTKIENNKQYIVYGILIASCIASFFIVSLVKSGGIIGFFVVGAFAYNEIFHKKAIFGFGIENAVIAWIVFAVVLVGLYFAFSKGPKIFFACSFGIIGPLIFVTGMETSLKMDWGFYRNVKDWQNISVTESIPTHFIAFAGVCGCCMFYQVWCVLRGK